MRAPVLHVLRLARRPSGAGAGAAAAASQAGSWRRPHILQQLHWEETLLRHDARNWFVLSRGGAPPAPHVTAATQQQTTARNGRGQHLDEEEPHDGGAKVGAGAAAGIEMDESDRTIVLGMSGKAERLVDLEAVREDRSKGAQVRLARRFTGGGTVVVDRNTLLTALILNAADVPCKPFPREIMRYTQTLFAPPIEDMLRMVFEMRENDYVLGDVKVGGNAQAIAARRWVHHTSWLWDFDAQAMARYLKLPEKRPEYRQDRPHSEFLTTLREHTDLRPDEWEDRLLEHLDTVFEVREASVTDVQTIWEGAGMTEAEWVQQNCRSVWENS